VRILVAEPLAAEGLALLRTQAEVDYAPELKRDELFGRLAGAQALIVRSGVKVDRAVIAASTQLVVIGRAGTGLDNIDLIAAREAGVTVVNAPDANTAAAAEHAIGLLFALARHIPAADASLRRGEWRRANFVGTELAGKTLGIVGLGRIGLGLAARAAGLQMTMLGADPFVSAGQALEYRVRLVELGELLARSDLVTLHVPLTAATRAMLGRAELATLKPTAVLVNTSRGGLVDEAALAEALSEGRLAGAALDVFADEPLPADSPLLSAPNTVLTPHLGASTREAQVRAGLQTAQAVLDVLAGHAQGYAAVR
jgi:D-3-phosphoglycerate dehydrogenase / 2-oxoglutarate reductase